MKQEKYQQNKNRRGTMIAYALIIMSVVSILLVSILKYTTSQMTFSINRVNRSESFQIAEAGIFFYRWYLAHEISGRTVQQIKDFWESGDAYGVDEPYEADFTDPEGGVIGRYKVEVQAPDVNSTIVIVKSTGWTLKDPDVKRVVQARFRRPSWSENAVLANDNMRFGSGTVVNGKIHSNKGIRFDGEATNVVSSALDKYDDPDHSGNNEFGVHTHVNPPPDSGINNTFRANEAPPTSPVPTRADVFQAGRQFPVTGVDFNGMLSDLNFMKSESQITGHGIYFDNAKCGSRTNLGRHIILNGGSMTVTKVTGHDSGIGGSNAITREGCSASYTIPDGGVVFVENNAWVEGTINNKKVTIVAANLSGGGNKTMYIGMNSILYTNFDGSDILGLIGQQDVEVVENSQNYLTVDAALLAQSGRVGMSHYGNHKNTITVNGSMATNLRYGFAWTDGTGYTNRNLNFDNNLLYFPPPYFPTGTEYYIDLWEEL
jgi:hypothetical protein